MIENKLTDEQVIKALECCSNTVSRRMCHICPINDEEDKTCVTVLTENALELLKSKDEKIELLQKTKQLNEAEIERLTNKCDDCAGCSEWKCDCSNIRKEFAERVIKKFDNLEYRDENFDMKHKGECILHEVVPKVVDMVLKEMEGN